MGHLHHLDEDEHAGFDGTTWYCKKCGRAGFKSNDAVYGHKRACRGAGTRLAEIRKNIEAEPPREPAREAEQAGSASQDAGTRQGASQGAGSAERANWNRFWESVQAPWRVQQEEERQLEDRVRALEQTQYNELLHLQSQKPESQFSLRALFLAGIAGFTGGYLVCRFFANPFLDKATEKTGMSLLGDGIKKLKK